MKGNVPDPSTEIETLRAQRDRLDARLAELQADRAASGPTASAAANRAAGHGSDRLVRWGTRLVLGFAALVVALMLVLAVGPLGLPYRDYFVLSGSMEPTLPVGSLIVMREAAADQLRVGDIITFHRPGQTAQLVTHRIERIETVGGRPMFVTKGDANAVPDAWLVPASGRGWVFDFDVPYLGYGLAALHSPLARLLLLIVPAVLLAALTLIDLWRPRRASNDAA